MGGRFHREGTLNTICTGSGRPNKQEKTTRRELLKGPKSLTSPQKPEKREKAAAKLIVHIQRVGRDVGDHKGGAEQRKPLGGKQKIRRGEEANPCRNLSGVFKALYYMTHTAPETFRGGHFKIEGRKRAVYISLKEAQ